MNEIRDKILVCNTIKYNDNITYVHCFSGNCGYFSLVQKNTASKKNILNRDFSRQLHPFNLYDVLLFKNKILEKDLIYSFKNLAVNIEAQAILKILSDLCRDLSQDKELWHDIYELLNYFFYTLDQADDFAQMLSALVKAQLKLLFKAGLANNVEDEIVRDLLYSVDIISIFNKIKTDSYSALFAYKIDYDLSCKLLTVNSRYFQKLLDCDYNNMSYLNNLSMLRNSFDILKKRRI